MPFHLTLAAPVRAGTTCATTCAPTCATRALQWRVIVSLRDHSLVSLRDHFLRSLRRLRVFFVCVFIFYACRSGVGDKYATVLLLFTRMINLFFTNSTHQSLRKCQPLDPSPLLAAEPYRGATLRFA